MNIMLKLNFLILFFLFILHSHAFDSSIGDIYIESKNLDIDLATKNGDIFKYNLKTKVSKLSSKKKFDNKIKGRIKAKFKINKNVGS